MHYCPVLPSEEVPKLNRRWRASSPRASVHGRGAQWWLVVVRAPLREPRAAAICWPWHSFLRSGSAAREQAHRVRWESPMATLRVHERARSGECARSCAEEGGGGREARTAVPRCRARGAWVSGEWRGCCVWNTTQARGFKSQKSTRSGPLRIAPTAMAKTTRRAVLYPSLWFGNQTFNRYASLPFR